MDQQEFYSLYPLDYLGKISGPAIHIEAADDDDALRRAQSLCASVECELWQGQRRLTRVSSKLNGHAVEKAGAGITMLRGLLGRELDSLDD